MPLCLSASLPLYFSAFLPLCLSLSAFAGVAPPKALGGQLPVAVPLSSQVTEAAAKQHHSQPGMLASAATQRVQWPPKLANAEASPANRSRCPWAVQFRCLKGDATTPPGGDAITLPQQRRSHTARKRPSGTTARAMQPHHPQTAHPHRRKGDAATPPEGPHLIAEAACPSDSRPMYPKGPWLLAG
eukprot:4462419-Alexandrium_andersonii.AAC.1